MGGLLNQDERPDVMAELVTTRADMTAVRRRHPHPTPVRSSTSTDDGGRPSPGPKMRSEALHRRDDVAGFGKVLGDVVAGQLGSIQTGVVGVVAGSPETTTAGIQAMAIRNPLTSTTPWIEMGTGPTCSPRVDVRPRRRHVDDVARC